MMGLLDDCEMLYGTRDLYDLLHISKEASDAAIKRAYRKLSLTVHPDRVEDDQKESATQKFQVLSKVCQVLLNDDQRKIYNEEGTILDDAAVQSDEKSWKNYWSNMFHMTTEDIRQFSDKYRNSEEEINDLIEVYKECKGDMDLILQQQLCCTIDDEPRFRKIIQCKINKDELPAYDAFVKETKAKRTKRKKFYEREAKEAEEARKEQGLDDDEKSLEQLILKRHRNRGREMDSFISQLEEKYAKKSSSKKVSTKKKKNK